MSAGRVETTTVVHSFRFFGNLLLFGGAAVIALIFGSLLHGELAKAWTAEFRRTLVFSSPEKRVQTNAALQKSERPQISQSQ